MSKKYLFFLLFVIFTILVCTGFYFFNPNFSNLINDNWTNESGKCQKNSVENVKSKLAQNQDKMSKIKQKLEFKYPNITNKNQQNLQKSENKNEQSTLLEDQVFWSIDKSSKCPENNLIRFDVANNEQKEIIKSVLGQDLEYEIWNR